MTRHTRGAGRRSTHTQRRTRCNSLYCAGSRAVDPPFDPPPLRLTASRRLAHGESLLAENALSGVEGRLPRFARLSSGRHSQAVSIELSLNYERRISPTGFHPGPSRRKYNSTGRAQRG